MTSLPVVALAAMALACTPTSVEVANPIVAPTQAEQPAASEPAPRPDRWIDLQIADAGEFSLGCAVEHGGRLWCWGPDPTLLAGFRPNLGPTEAKQSRRWSPPTLVNEVDDARAVSVSTSHVCRLDGDGRVHCVAESNPSWWTVEGVQDAVDVIVADLRGCALEADGELRCWEKSRASRLVQRDVVAADFVLTGGCALDRSGQLACWSWLPHEGRPIEELRQVSAASGIVSLGVASDQYGNAVYILDDRGHVQRYRFDTTHESGEWETLGEVVDGVEIAVAGSHVCVRKVDGTAVCRGRNSHGQLGDGTSVRRDDFVEIQARDVVGLSLGDLRTCVRTRTDIACSGSVQMGSELLQQHTLPDLVAVSLAAHGATTCAVDREGSMHCWGSELFDRRELAENFGVHAATTPTLVTTGVGALHGLWAREHDVMWVGAEGRLDRARWADEPVGKLVPVRARKTARTILELETDHVVCAIEGSNILTCGNEAEPRARVKGVRDPITVAIGSHVICVIDGSRRVACGVYPDGTEDFEVALTRIPEVERAQGIAARIHDACALIDDGRVRCWTNERADGQRWRYHPGRVHDVGVGDVAAIVGSRSEYCSLDRAGAMGCWAPRQSDSVSPRSAPTLDIPVVELVAGDGHWCARDGEGRVTCWGDESHGQLGRIPPWIALSPEPLDFGVAPPRSH